MSNYIKKSDITAILDDAVEKINSLPETRETKTNFWEEEATFWEEEAKERQQVIDNLTSKISSLVSDNAGLNEYKNYLKSANETLKKMLLEAWGKTK